MKTTRMSAISLLVLVVGLLAGIANADFIFGEPINLGPLVNSSFDDWAPSISVYGLSLYFNSNRPDGYGNHDLWVTTRPTIYDPWDTPINLGSIVNSSDKEAFPSVSADGLSLFFESTRSGGYGGHDLWVTTRATVSDLIGTASESWPNCKHLGPRRYAAHLSRRIVSVLRVLAWRRVWRFRYLGHDADNAGCRLVCPSESRRHGKQFGFRWSPQYLGRRPDALF